MPQSPTPTSAAPPVYHQIASSIEHLIETGQYAAGQRLPSIRQLCEQFGVADLTVKRALRRLADRGLTESVVGSGTFVRQPGMLDTRSSGLTTVGLVMLGPPPRPIYMHEINRIQNKLMQLGHPMFYCSIESDEQLPIVRARLAEAGAGCLIVFPRHGRHQTPIPGRAILRGPSLPTLVIESASDEFPFVRTDIEHSSRMLVRHLYDLGHRRITIATKFEFKITGVRTALEQIADPTLVIDFVHASTDSIHEMMNAAIDVIHKRPTAVIACNDMMADVMIQQFEMHGLAVPQDISIASYDDHPEWSYRSRVPMTSVRHPYEEIADEVASWAHSRLTTTSRGNRRFQRVISGSLIVRDSTGAV